MAVDTTDLDALNRIIGELAERVDRAEETIALIAERMGDGRVLNGTHELRSEANKRIRARAIDNTPLVQHTGAAGSLERVREFCGSDASVNQEPNSAALKLIWHGQECRVPPGQWLARDPSTNRIYPTNPPQL
jgi:hypothetical protein